MTNSVYFLPMRRSHRVFILAYGGCQLLDVTGPAAVFGAANEASGRPIYDLRIVSPDGGAVVSNSGVAIHSRRIGGASGITPRALRAALSPREGRGTAR